MFINPYDDVIFGPNDVTKHKICIISILDWNLEVVFVLCAQNNSTNLSTLSKGLLMRSANPRPASATPGTG